ncbi:hypothetical protein ACWIGI_28690 [Nocardia sp. NPDC055321]
MITREDQAARVTYFGDAPVVDADGYAVEIGCPDEGSQYCQLRVAAHADGHGPKIRADLTADGVREILARLVAWESSHDAPFMRKLAVRVVDWLRVHDFDAFTSLAHYMQSCLPEGATR